MSPFDRRDDDEQLDSDVESEGANLVGVDATEHSPLLPNDLPADIVPPKSLQRRVLVMCIVFLFLVEVSQFIMEAPLQNILEDIICRNYYPDHLLREPSIQDARCKSNEVQKTLAMVRGWSLAFEMATPDKIIKAMIAQFPFGIIADKYGRRPVLFLSVLGCTLQTTWVMVVLLFPNVFSIWAMLPGSLFYLIGGGGAMAGAMVWTIVADVVPVADRTSVFYQLTAAVLMINVIINPISAWFLKFDPWIPMWLSFGFLIVGTASTLLIPETLSLRHKADDRRRNPGAHESQAGHEERENGTSKKNVLQQAWFTVKNDMGHVWRFIFASKSIMVLILALSAYMPIKLAFSSILLQYMSKRFDWTWSTATYISTAGILATVVALLVILPLASLLIEKRYNYGPLHRDLFLSRVSISFLAVGVLLMTFAAAPWLFITSLVIASLGNGFAALCRALLNAVVEPHTLATLNTTISLSEMLIALISGPATGWLLSKGMDLGGAWQGLPSRYDFEYEEDDDEDSGDVDIENKYYNAKQLKLSDPQDAIDEFLGIPPLEDEKGEWGFKGLKQAIKLEFKLGQYDKATDHYAELLTYVKSAVTRNYSEKSINNMLDYIEKGADGSGAIRCMEQFYSLTLQSFQSTNNERLWLKTNIKLAKLLLDRKEYPAVSKKLKELHKTCQREDGSDDPSKGTYSLEIYALEIQMFAETKNNKQLKALYQRALKVKSAVPHPRIMGIIRECGGKMHMSEENWKEAQSDFFESFRNYDEAGSLQRIQVLKYLLLTTMLMKSNINPFDSQETKPYKTDPRISAMTDLVDAYQRDDVHTYEKVLQRNQDILDDSFIAENIDEVTRNMRTKGVVKLIAPYTRMKLAWIAKQLKISEPEVQDILGFLIIDGKISGRINEQEGLLEITSDADSERIVALQGLTTSISELFVTIFREGDGFRSIENSAAEDQGVDIQGIPLGKGPGGRGPALRKKGKGTAAGWA
ncbi:COP9 signalosome complex subunit 2 [Dactylonectria estremocensis]|uniref:COP9 signalosome complex subunit 2 n=1 Tax=Dactylonectria estremocensis TaxID=1079267 RepID=A0A9P9IMV7_9HYPO|nr:COP9 signalosome complex subunit 2 [Dactylonectria estremocensis]